MRHVAPGVILGVVVLCFAGLARAANETPRQHFASIYQPCGFELGDNSAALKALADSQHYDFTAYTNTSGTRPAGHEPATLDNFATLASDGIVEIESHGGPDNVLVECWPADAAGKDARDARARRLCGGKDLPGGVRLRCPADLVGDNGQRLVQRGLNVEWENSDVGIGITPSGIKKLWSPTSHEILFVGSCDSFGKPLRDAFERTNIEYFGYADKCLQAGVNKDTGKLYKRLSGNEFEGKARRMGGQTALFRPDGTCSAFGRGGFTDILRHDGPGDTTVAPIVAWAGVTNQCKGGSESFAPAGQVFMVANGGQVDVNGHVDFDTDMNTAPDPKTVISTAGSACGAEILSASWTGTTRLDFQVRLHGTTGGPIVLTVKNDIAKSLHDDRELDGNQNPNPFKFNGVGPNRDDYKPRNNACVITPAAAPVLAPPFSPLALLADPPLTVTTTLTPVGAPGTAADGSASLSGDEDHLGVGLSASNLVSGANMIPGSAVTFDPNPVDVLSGSEYTAQVAVQLPASQPVGTYTGKVAASDGVVTAETDLTVLVDHPPVLRTPSSWKAIAGETRSLPLTARDSDAERIVIGANFLPAGARIVPIGKGRATLVYQPKLSDAGLKTTIPLLAHNPVDVAGTPPQDARPLLVQVVSPKAVPLVRLGSTIRVRRGTGRLPLRCRNKRCRGRLSVMLGRATLGSGSFSIPAGRNGTVTVRLTKRGAVLLARRGHVRARAKAVYPDGIGGRRTAARQVTLVAG